MGFNSAFKGLRILRLVKYCVTCMECHSYRFKLQPATKYQVHVPE